MAILFVPEALAIIKKLPVEARKWQGRKRTPRAFFTVLWETGLGPTTVHQIEVGRHYVKGSSDLTITAEIDKARYDRVYEVGIWAAQVFIKHTQAPAEEASGV